MRAGSGFCFHPDIHEAWQPGPRAHEDGFIAHLKDLIDGQDLSDDHICLYINTNGFEVVNFFLYDRLWQAEFRDSIDKYAAGKMKGFIDRDLVTHLGKVAGHCQSTGTRTDDSYFMSI